MRRKKARIRKKQEKNVQKNDDVNLTYSSSNTLSKVFIKYIAVVTTFAHFLYDKSNEINRMRSNMHLFQHSLLKFFKTKIIL